MKKRKNIVLFLSFVFATLLIVPLFVGCDVAETKAIINSASGIVQTEYSDTTAHAIYLSAVNNSYQQTTIKSVSTTTSCSSNLIDTKETITTYWRNNENTTDMLVIKADGNRLFYTNINGTYYKFDVATHTCYVNAEIIYETIYPFALCDSIVGGVGYGDGYGKVYTEIGTSPEAESLTTISIKDNLVVGLEIVNYYTGPGGPHLPKGLLQATLEYNVNVEDVFAGMPKSISGWTLA